MSDYTIYAIKGVDRGQCDILASLKKGEGRYGWGYVQTADLYQLKKRIEESGWHTLTPEEQDCYQSVLLDFKKDDYVICINVPEWGKCTVARVTGSYFWRFEDSDLNHRFPVDPESVFTFDRNDAEVHPALSARLKLQGRYWRIYLRKEFEALIEAFTKGATGKSRTPETNMVFLAKEIQPFLLDITAKIHHSHPNFALETLLADTFKNMPGVIKAEVHGRGGSAGDHGADVIVVFESGLPFPGLQRQQTCVVQAKSFEGEHWDTQAVADIERAFDRYPEADIGLIVSTATSSTEALDEAIEKLRETSKKPILLLIGADVASFLLRYNRSLTGLLES